MLKAEEPAPAKKFDTFYEKAFDPKAFFGDVKEEIKSQSQSSGAQRAAAPQDSNFSAKLDEIEDALRSGGQWLSGGSAPGAADAEAIEAVRAQLKEKRPDPRVYPNLFGWYAMISKFAPSKLASLK